MKFVPKSLLSGATMQKAFGNIDLHFRIKESSIHFYVRKCALKCHILVCLFFFKHYILCEFNNVSYEVAFSTVFFKVMQKGSISREAAQST